MKENKLIKSVTDRQLPDFEDVREACIKQEKPKTKIFKLKPSRLIAVAVIAAISIAGMAAAVANPNGGIFGINRKPETSSASEANKKKSKSDKNSSNGGYKSSNSTKSKKAEETPAERTRRYIRYMNKNDINVNWLTFLGKIEDYRICITGGNGSSNFACDYIIGDYTFKTATQFYPYGLAIYAVSKDLCCTLSEAYEMELFKDFGAITELIMNSAETADYGIEVGLNDPSHEALRSYFGTKNACALAPLGGTEEYSVFYNITSDYTGESGYNLILNNLSFEMNDTQTDYNLGLYIVYNGEAYTLSQAISDNIITDEKQLCELILSQSNQYVPFNWTLSYTEQESEEQAQTIIE